MWRRSLRGIGAIISDASELQFKKFESLQGQLRRYLTHATLRMLAEDSRLRRSGQVSNADALTFSLSCGAVLNDLVRTRADRCFEFPVMRYAESIRKSGRHWFFQLWCSSLSHCYMCIVAVQWLCAAKSAPETVDFYTSATLVSMLHFVE